MSYGGSIITNGTKAMYAVPVTLGSGKAVEDAIAAAVKSVGFTHEQTSGYGIKSEKDFSAYPSSYGGSANAYRYL